MADIEMKHFSHRHALMLNKEYNARESDVCYGCNEKVLSSKSFVYTCNSHAAGTTSDADIDSDCVNFLLHKSCADLPTTIMHPNHIHLLFLRERPLLEWCTCDICEIVSRWFTYSCYHCGFNVCITCAASQVQSLENRNFHHPAHNQHPLILVQRPSSFKCDACTDTTADLSYICTMCPFWIHQTCAHARTPIQSKFHLKHPLCLAYSLPQVYRKFSQFCRLCREKVIPTQWLYYCPDCRFFLHFKCAMSTTTKLRYSEDENDDVGGSNLVRLPVIDESSLNLLLEQLVRMMSLTQNINATAPDLIDHWAHVKHRLELRTYDNDYKDERLLLLMCDGCTKPIRRDDDEFYGCVPCNFFLHKFCAELPIQFGHHLLPGQKLFISQCGKPYQYFFCSLCKIAGNGIFFGSYFKLMKLHIGCATLPERIKHEAHNHPLTQVKPPARVICNACRMVHHTFIIYSCNICDYHICSTCIMKVSRVRNRWDPHPLYLIYDPMVITDHSHEFNCEFCSEEINTNGWFYHCNICDLSFHLDCYDPFYKYSCIKFGATNIGIHKLHHHQLTLVLNIKKLHGRCKHCHRRLNGNPVLECAPCKILFCIDCANNI